MSPIILPMIAIIIGLIDYSWMEMIYGNFTYELDDNEIVIRQGVIGRRTTVIPYATIQDITAERSAAERLLGIATLEIETAGSLRLASEITLPGIAEKDTLVRELTHRAEKAKNTMGQETRTQGTDASHLLSEILAELKAIDLHLSHPVKNSRKNSTGNEEGENKNSLRNNEGENKIPPLREEGGKNENKKEESSFEKYEHFRKG